MIIIVLSIYLVPCICIAIEAIFSYCSSILSYLPISFLFLVTKPGLGSPKGSNPGTAGLAPNGPSKKSAEPSPSISKT